MMRPSRWIVGALVLPTVALTLSAAVFQEEKGQRQLGFKDTPILPGTEWHVHDGDRPQPPVVDPATPSTQDEPGQPPADAVVLFDGADTSEWRNRAGNKIGWKVEDGALVIQPGEGDILSRPEFGDCQLHLEFASPVPATSRDQGRGNSGVMFFGIYEVQILDSYDNLTYPDGMAAAIYGQHPPLVNASRPPGDWQTYDIIFKAPRFAEDGSVESPAYITMLHNGVLVHNNVELLGPMAYRALPEYRPHGPKGPILLQDHGNPVRFRNIWVRELVEPEE